MTTLTSASLSRKHQEHTARMIGLLTVSLGLGLTTLTSTGSHMLTFVLRFLYFRFRTSASALQHFPLALYMLIFPQTHPIKHLDVMKRK